METILFYCFSVLALLFGFLVVANPLSRNPVASAMFLVLTILSLAGFFVLLHAFFLAAVQILVYAGAVMVLFLFVLMVLSVEEERRRRVGRFALIVGGGSVLALLAVFGAALAGGASVSGGPAIEGDAQALGKLLFSRYLLPFELVAVLVLIAVVGVVLLGKKRTQPTRPPGEISRVRDERGS